MKEFDLKLVKHIDPFHSVMSKQLQELFHHAYTTSGNVLEVGSFRGRSTVAIASGLKERRIGNLFCIDPWNTHDVTIKDHISNLEKVGFNDIIVRIQDLSCNVLNKKLPKELFESKLGLLFIDGDHRKEAVEKDLQWIKFVRKKGIVIFHDYGNDYVTKISGPKIIIDKYNKRNRGVLKQINLIGSLIVFVKLV